MPVEIQRDGNGIIKVVKGWQEPNGCLSLLPEVVRTQLVAKFPGAVDFFPDTEKSEINCFFVLPLNQVTSGTIGQLDGFFYNGDLPKSLTVIGGSIGSPNDMRYSKYVVAGDRAYFFSPDDYTHFQAFKTILEIDSDIYTRQIRPQSAGMAYIIFSLEDGRVLERFFSGTSATLEDAGILNTNSSLEYAMSTLRTSLDDFFEFG